jgi:hypothetical protein
VKLSIAACVTSVALSACAPRVLTPNACLVADASGFIGAGTAQERITVAQNGAPCVIFLSIRGGSMGDGTVTTPPAHGAATVRVTAEATLISYTPARDFVGPDRFDVAFGPNFNMAVAVEVVAPEAAAPGRP